MTDRQQNVQQPPAKRQRHSSNAFLRSWAWKREHQPDRVRFDRPYTHELELPGGGACTLTVHQQRFSAERTGFASTVWDSSIVVAKWAEKAGIWAGRRVLDLSAGCGLVGLVCAKLGAAVTATDLEPNLPLLRRNAEANGCDIEVREHAWGSSVAVLEPPYHLVAVCDCMYVREAVPALVRTLAALAGPETQVIVAHGRNRQAETAFLAAASTHFMVAEVPSEELDEVYQCSDVTVVRLRLKREACADADAQVDEPQALA